MVTSPHPPLSLDPAPVTEAVSGVAGTTTTRGSPESWRGDRTTGGAIPKRWWWGGKLGVVGEGVAE